MAVLAALTFVVKGQNVLPLTLLRRSQCSAQVGPLEIAWAEVDIWIVCDGVSIGFPLLIAIASF